MCNAKRAIAYMAPSLLTVLLLAAPATSAGKLYKWVDENGQVHYGDRIPADQSDKRHAVLDGQGLVRERVRAAKTPEELARERRQAREEAERERQAREQQARDNILLSTFPTERDLLLTRDDRVAGVDSTIKITEKVLADLEQKLIEVDSEIRGYESTRQEVPPNLLVERTTLQQQIERNRETLEVKRDEREQLVVKFEADLSRYRDLKALRGR